MSAWFVFAIIPAICLVILVFFLAARSVSYRVQTRAATSPIYVSRSPNQDCVSGGTGVVHNTVPVYTVNQVEEGQVPRSDACGHPNSVQLHAVNETSQPMKADDPPPSYTEAVKTTASDTEGNKENES